MAKAYDRVSRIFLSKVLRSFGFSERIIDMVVRLVSNNWYSVIINRQSFGFFQSTRGLKQGDPLLPTLFIIAAEVLARNLNKLSKDQNFKGFGLPKWSPEINHLSYADDTILFYSGHPNSMKKMKNVLRGYGIVSGKMINIDKCLFYLHEKVPVGTCRQIKKDYRLWNAIIETDSLSLKKIILKTWRIPWEIIEKVEEIRELLQKTRATITHVFREGNCLADALANIAIESQTDHEYQAWQELPLVLRKILNSDKAQIPNYRIKTRRITHNDT
ncbi:uncharacterized protein [Solanum tuberosum]|uniref:uncharacterized protein n=1 Tax=Solanum tuberosum TaxID=4113 RepID=UPI00073A0AA9|nr:PREDICTED: uncharacterized protein LOC107060398 [Solanum tuberosum]